MSQQPETVLSYATLAPEIRHRWLLQFARWAGALPLIVGISTMLLFLVKPAVELMLVGMWTILIGTGLVSIGFVCALVYFFTNRLKDKELRSRVNRQTGWAILLLLVNFPAAWACVVIAVKFRDHAF